MTVDLHMPAAQLPEEPTDLQRDHSTAINASISDIQGSMLEYNAIDTSTIFTWGRHSDGRTITVKTSTIDEGEIDTLIREGRMIQKRLTNSRRTGPTNKAKVL
mgnify:CR=1 FL=1